MAARIQAEPKPVFQADPDPDTDTESGADAGAGRAARRQRRTQLERREEAGRRILECAMELVSTKGVAGTTLNEAGELAGYSRGLPAHHFGSKEGLLIALVEHIETGFREARASADSWEDGIDAVLGVVSLYIERTVAQDRATRALNILFTEGFVNGGPLSDALDRLNRNSLAYLETQIRIGVDKGQIREDVDPAAEALVILGSLRGISAQFLLGTPNANPQRVRESLLRTVELALRPDA
ncbi:TetR/AcrR family transcriptional regulator [Cupriavidus sp. L7L]|uniref:TetR/AcrR family transcriptional regulator n=1 Tax=Cupriavidus sp. L7L TaxID=2546443 RepID=UPI001055246C|nr:TetR/AcrR family transcriptional regulator [Cupriavidus sp. L7L]TDF62222.1 TetR/AcrR family transcriptional regulator [Cupriavidus sp. L7L]